MKIVLTPKQKALEINLNKEIYGSFAEIGAGQETVRFFYQAGAASGTLAKAMSAYDKNFSDIIYGKEEDGRYVTLGRLRKMLQKEIDLIEARLVQNITKKKLYFSYANTVSTIDFAKTFKGHGWVGIVFKNKHNKPYSEIIIHVRFKQTDARLQQESLGKMGVNLIYGAYYYNKDVKKLLDSLYDDLNKDEIEIDVINFSGPAFKKVDNRIMSLELVKRGMTEAVGFSPSGEAVLLENLLYKKNIFTIRGSFSPVNHLHINMLNAGLDLFEKEDGVDKNNTQILFEITLNNLLDGGVIDEQDFLNRADIICAMGYHVIISNYSEFYLLADYYSRFSTNKSALVMGVNNLIHIFEEQYYRGLSGGILEAFGKLFANNLKIFLYPYIEKESGEILNSHNLKVENNLKDLYKYFKKNKQIIDITDYKMETLTIKGKTILKQIVNNEDDWKKCVPAIVSTLVIEKEMFGFCKNKKE
ncbi:MAG: TonB-dependent receptor [Solirubrobacteraceae bacterium]